MNNLEPVNWGEDSLTAFFKGSYENQFATYANKEPIHKLLVEVDEIFSYAAKHFTNVNPLMGAFFGRAQCAFRTGCILSYSTLIPESYLMFRSCLEYSGYALFTHDDVKKAELWLKRNESEDLKKLMRKTFQNSAILSSIKSKDSKLKEIYEELYERTLDFGAHPNEKGVSSSMEISENEEETLFRVSYFHGEGLPLNFSLKTAAEVGICSLFLFQFIWPEKFQLLGICEKLQNFRKRLQGLRIE